MATKVILLTLLPLIVLWIVVIAFCKAFVPQSKANSKHLSDAACFDPTEALHEII